MESCSKNHLNASIQKGAIIVIEIRLNQCSVATILQLAP